MAEEEVNYASVVFKTNKNSPPEVKKEDETVYDDVKARSETAEQTADTNAAVEGEQQKEEVSAGFVPDKKANNRRRHHQQLACCLGILCVILLLGIIAVCVYLTLSHKSEQDQLKDNQTTLQAVNRNLTNLNNKLSSENEMLRRNHSDLTQANTVLENKITNLTAKNQNLTTQIQQLETEKNNLTQQIQNMETNWNELNVSRAQWSINAYCPKQNEDRQCKPCQAGWKDFGSNCYAYNNPDPPGRKTWEEAQENCRGKNSDLAVIVNEAEKTFIDDWENLGNDGFWIGLRAEDGRWKSINGSDLTENSWIQQPATDGFCAVFVSNQQWKSVNCTDRQQWICQKNALTV